MESPPYGTTMAFSPFARWLAQVKSSLTYRHPKLLALLLDAYGAPLDFSSESLAVQESAHASCHT
jgi:hypothetical protein